MTDTSYKKTLDKKGLHNAARILWRYALLRKREFAVAVAAVLFVALVEATRPYLIGLFFDELTTVAAGDVTTKVWLYIGIISLLFMVASVGRWLYNRCAESLRAHTIAAYRQKAIEALMNYPVSFFKKQKTGEVHEIISRTEGAMGDFISYNLPSISINILTLSFSVGFVFFISWILGAILLLGLVVFFLCVRIITPKIRELTKQLNDALNEIKNQYFEVITNVFEVKRNTTEHQEIEEIKNQYTNEFIPRTLKEQYLWINNDLIRKTVIVVTQTALFVAGVFLIIQESITPGNLVSLILYSSMSFRPVYQLSDIWLYLNRTLIKIQEGEELLTHKIEQQGEIARQIKDGDILFKDVSFAYDEQHVLENISFTVPAGSTVALVGESGAGKTTTIELLGGYYFPSEGSVEIDNIPTTDYKKKTLRSALGYVSQEVTLFNDTIARNIAYGASGDVAQEDIIDAAKAAGIHTYITKLPDEYETNVGERGLKLSVGQKQRIAIARAFLRDPKILILDEPTSALDAKTERHVTDSLKKLMKDRTTVIIAHRLSTTRDADQILVFKDGHIIERGTHEELIEKDGEYTHMYNEHIGLH